VTGWEKLLVLLILVGCAAPVSAQTIAPEFHGFWANVDARNSNWWEIASDRVVNYGGGFKDGKCRAAAAAIVSTDRIEIQFGNKSTVQMRTLGDRLLFDGDIGTAYHRQVARSEICRRADGTYFEGAPYPR
jgi:hypothetical protein